MSEERPQWLPKVDLRAITRDSDICTTIVEVKWHGYFYEWLRFGSLSRVSDNGKWLGAHLREGITDFEHSSAYAVHFEVSRVELDTIHSGVVTLKAWVAGSDEDADTLCVPAQSILSVDELGGEPCEGPSPDCRDENHLIVKQFTPKADVKLWKRLRGRELRISIITRHRKEIDDAEGATAALNPVEAAIRNHELGVIQMHAESYHEIGRSMLNRADLIERGSMVDDDLDGIRDEVAEGLRTVATEYINAGLEHRHPNRKAGSTG